LPGLVSTSGGGPSGRRQSPARVGPVCGANRHVNPHIAHHHRGRDSGLRWRENTPWIFRFSGAVSKGPQGPQGIHAQCLERRPPVGLHIPTRGGRTPSERGRRPRQWGALRNSCHCPLWGGVPGSACIAAQATRCPTPITAGPGHRVLASPAPLFLGVASSWMKSGGFGRRAQGPDPAGKRTGPGLASTSPQQGNRRALHPNRFRGGGNGNGVTVPVYEDV